MTDKSSSKKQTWICCKEMLYSKAQKLQELVMSSKLRLLPKHGTGKWEKTSNQSSNSCSTNNSTKTSEKSTNSWTQSRKPELNNQMKKTTCHRLHRCSPNLWWRLCSLCLRNQLWKKSLKLLLCSTMTNYLLHCISALKTKSDRVLNNYQ